MTVVNEDIAGLLAATRSEEAFILENAIINGWWDAYVAQGLNRRRLNETEAEFARRVYRHAMQGALGLVRNSPLCKASPDMLEALKIADRLLSESPPVDDWPEIRDAIAKAEGV